MKTRFDNWFDNQYHEAIQLCKWEEAEYLLDNKEVIEYAFNKVASLIYDTTTELQLELHADGVKGVKL